MDELIGEVEPAEDSDDEEKKTKAYLYTDGFAMESQKYIQNYHHELFIHIHLKNKKLFFFKKKQKKKHKNLSKTNKTVIQFYKSQKTIFCLFLFF